MGSSKRLFLSSFVAVFIGLAVILTPLLIVPNTGYIAEYSRQTMAPIDIQPTPGSSPLAGEPPLKSTIEAASQDHSKKVYPAYTLEINLTSNKGSFTVIRGKSITLPVEIRSWVNESINIELRLLSPFHEPLTPDITFQTRGAEILNPYEAVDTQVTISVSENTAPGEYSVILTGDLQEPLEHNNEIAIAFILKVI